MRDQSYSETPAGSEVVCVGVLAPPASELILGPRVGSQGYIYVV